jgi:hypothetical protein
MSGACFWNREAGLIDKSQRQYPRLTELHFDTMTGAEPGAFQPMAGQPDFGCYPAIKVVPGGFDFQSASVHHLVKHVIPAHSGERNGLKESRLGATVTAPPPPAWANGLRPIIGTSTLTTESPLEKKGRGLSAIHKLKAQSALAPARGCVKTRSWF